MGVEQRPARDEDIPELARLVAGIASYHESLDSRARFDWYQIRDAPNWLRAVLHRDHHAIWVVDPGTSRLAGYLWAHLRRDHQGGLPKVRGFISQAYLDEEWRGKGLMRPMLEMAYEWFRSKEIEVVTLTVFHRNWLGSAAWYKHGYEDWTHERRIELKPRAKSS